LQSQLLQSNYTAFQKNKKRQSKPKVFSTKILDPSLKGCSEIFFPNYIHNKRKDQVSQTTSAGACILLGSKFQIEGIEFWS
jgi:hypothetical protein